MKFDAVTLAKSRKNPTEAANLLREYVQACILKSLHESRAFESISFVGGTALRFLYSLPRFSEDLDFSLESPANYTPLAWLEKLKRDLSFQGFEASLHFNDRKTVHTAWVRIANLLEPAGLSPRPDQKLAIRLEIDTKPPAGAQTERRMVNRYCLFGIRHHDLPSLMAGKIRTILTRPYAKGRDWFDVLWYASQIPAVTPNLLLLSNALAQGEAGAKRLTQAAAWKKSLLVKLDSLNFEALRADILPFLEREEDANAMTKENLHALLFQSHGEFG